jgi:hypothetical protein
MKIDLVQARLEQHQKVRLQELTKLTGLSQAEVVRRLIENSDVAPVPSPVSYIPSRDAADTGAQRSAMAV